MSALVLYLLNDAQAALIRLLISAVSCCSNVIVCPRYFALSHAGDISTLMLLIATSFLLFEHWLLRMFVLSEWFFNPTLSVLCFSSLTSFLGAAPATKRTRAQCHLEYCVEEQTGQWIALRPSPLYLEHVTFLVRQDCRFLFRV